MCDGNFDFEEIGQEFHNMSVAFELCDFKESVCCGSFFIADRNSSICFLRFMIVN